MTPIVAPLGDMSDTGGPASTTPESPTQVLVRQPATTTIVTDDGDPGTPLTGGAIAGIVIGSIAGFLLFMWIVRACINFQYPEYWGNTMEPVHEREKSSHHHRHHGHHHHHHHHRHGNGHRRSRSGHSHRSPNRIRTTVYPPQAVYHQDTRPVVQSRGYPTHY